MQQIGYVFAAFYALWILYLAVMNLKGARDDGTLGPFALFFGLPVFVTGYALNVLINVFVMSVILLELPRLRELLVSARVQRHVRGDGYRAAVCRWIAVHLLNPFDPRGFHIRM